MKLRWPRSVRAIKGPRRTPPDPPFLIVGLGNPEPRYDGTRHNAGFWVLDALADEWGVRYRGRGPAWLAEHSVGARRVVLGKPRTYMNRSGVAVRALTHASGAPPEQLLVVYDDVDLSAGRLRLRNKGSAGTHNGMRSIVQALGTTEFPRLRVGVGPPPGGSDLADFVLAPLGQTEAKQFQEPISHAVEAVGVWLDEGITAAMNRFN